MKQIATILGDLTRKNLRPLWFRLLLRVRYWREDFSPEFYLGNYPDLAAAGVDPYEHYVRFGRAEGRLGSNNQGGGEVDTPPSFDVKGDFDLIDACRETVLVVSHEGTRTGAPVLTYNLVKQLIRKYNVVALFLGPGPILEACHLAGAVVVGPIAVKGTPSVAEKVIRNIVDKAPIRFAMVNSIESRYVLEWLAKRRIPTLSLIHEFAANTRPSGAFPETTFWSGQTVYSSQITRDNALAEFPELRMREHPVIPQGRCVLPQGSEEQRIDEDARIRRVMRPENFPVDGRVVLGAGTLHIRKGVELFIDCAAHIRRRRPDLPLRFVWIGKEFDPEYSLFMADQVRRADLEDVVYFANEVVNLETAYSLADVFVLSSRLDPLPNVVVDAMARRVPVVCFDKTTGMADVLRECGLGDACVAEYLDVDEMAGKVLALLESESLRNGVVERAARLVATTFDMATYVDRLEQLAAGEVERIAQQQRDVEALSEVKLLRMDYFRPPHLRWSEDEAIQVYVRSWANCVGRRKLFPGFHPGIYLERHGTARRGVDPLVDYLRAGRPQGPWNYGLITPQEESTPLPPGLRVGLHIHAYYPDLFPALLERLRQNRVRPDLLVSVANPDAQRAIEAHLGDHDEATVDVRVVPNRGRDIGPFLTEFGNAIHEKYDIIGHLHTKKTADIRDESVGRTWYLFLLENLLGGQFPMADIILGRMAADPNIGMVFPDDPNAIGWDKNLEYVKALLPRLGIERVYREILFPVGTMFWARTEVLKPLFDLNLRWADYPEEPLPYDGSVVHGLERILGVLVMSGKSMLTLTNVPGRSR